MKEFLKNSFIEVGLQDNNIPKLIFAKSCSQKLAQASPSVRLKKKNKKTLLATFHHFLSNTQINKTEPRNGENKEQRLVLILKVEDWENYYR